LLECASSLCKLNLAGNGIQNAGAVKLARAISTLSGSIQILDVSENPDISDQSLRLLNKWAKRAGLSLASLSDDCITIDINMYTLETSLHCDIELD
jgi:hypothetical protein